jgi:hypothetical protein
LSSILVSHLYRGGRYLFVAYRSVIERMHMLTSFGSVLINPIYIFI